MNLLVYEHVTGGGFADKRISPSILSEGYGMLRALISDFRSAGYKVTTFLDLRLKAFNPPIEADNIISISSHKELDKALNKISKDVDAVYIIAPESDQVLQKLVEAVEDSSGTSLNCQVNAIEKASNKMEIYKILRKTGLWVPETLIVDLRENVKQIECMVDELGFPLVFKPICGVGCCGLSVIRDVSQIAAAVDKIMKESSNECFIAQRLIKGVAASVSLISNGEKASPITLNKQMITLAPPSSDSSYNGGIVPLRHSLEKEALRVARITIKSLTGLRGYIGVDMVLTRKEPVVMEVNPRLTTSYIGLRKVVNFNPAQAIINAVLKRRPPENVQSSGYTFFSKVKVPAPTREILLKTYGLKEVMSPPFSVPSDEAAYALLVSYSAKLKDAEIGLHQAKKRLLNALSQE